MSLNIGCSGSRFVVVRNLTMKLNFSDKVIFGDLVISKKTGMPKVDKETGEVIVDKDGNPVPARTYMRFKAKFVGQAFEKAKGLAEGTAVDILQGWLEKEEYTTQKGDYRSDIYCIVSDFELSNFEESSGVQ